MVILERWEKLKETQPNAYELVKKAANEKVEILKSSKTPEKDQLKLFRRACIILDRNKILTGADPLLEDWEELKAL